MKAITTPFNCVLNKNDNKCQKNFYDVYYPPILVIFGKFRKNQQNFKKWTLLGNQTHATMQIPGWHFSSALQSDRQKKSFHSDKKENGAVGSLWVKALLLVVAL